MRYKQVLFPAIYNFPNWDIVLKNNECIVFNFIVVWNMFCRVNVNLMTLNIKICFVPFVSILSLEAAVFLSLFQYIKLFLVILNI